MKHILSLSMFKLESYQCSLAMFKFSKQIVDKYRVLKKNSVGAVFIDVRNMHGCYMIFDCMRTSLTRDKYRYIQYWLSPTDVPRPLTNDLLVFLFQTIDAQCVK